MIDHKVDDDVKKMTMGQTMLKLVISGVKWDLPKIELQVRKRSNRYTSASRIKILSSHNQIEDIKLKMTPNSHLKDQDQL